MVQKTLIKHSDQCIALWQGIEKIFLVKFGLLKQLSNIIIRVLVKMEIIAEKMGTKSLLSREYKQQLLNWFTSMLIILLLLLEIRLSLSKITINSLLSPFDYVIYSFI